MRKPNPTYSPSNAASMSLAISKVTILAAARKAMTATSATNEAATPTAISTRFFLLHWVGRPQFPQATQRDAEAENACA